MTAVARRQAGRLLLAALSLGPAGCREELGPERWPTTRVTGTVRVGRTPVRGGFIEFHPVAGTVGNLRVAPIGSDGRYAADGVAVGMHRIGFAQLSGAGPFRYEFRSYLSQLRRDVRPGPSSTMDIDLTEEAAAQAAARRKLEAAP